MTLRDKLNKSIEQKSSSLWAGCLYKGERRQVIQKVDDYGNKKKITQLGKDIKEELRFEPYSNHARLATLAAYPDAKKDKNGDIILEEVDIFAAFSSVEETFKIRYQKWDATGLAASCDGNKIIQVRELYQDSFKHTRTRMISCDKPCPIVDEPLGVACPNGCNKEGELLFYIPQLVESGIGLPVKMTLHAWSDLIGVSECLNAIAAELDSIKLENGINPDGNIKLSPFICGTPGNMIWLKLNRNKTKIRRPIIDDKTKLRTGKKTEGEAWAVSISFHPAYLFVLRQWQNAIALSKISLPYAPTGLLEQFKLTPLADGDYKPVLQADGSAPPLPAVQPPILEAIDVTPPSDWKIKAMNWGLTQGLKPETLSAIADKSRTESDFKSLCEKALIIKWAKDAGVDEAAAKKLLKECQDVELFRNKVEEYLKAEEKEQSQTQILKIEEPLKAEQKEQAQTPTSKPLIVEVNQGEELIEWAIKQGIQKEKAIAVFEESPNKIEFKDKIYLILEEKVL